MKRFCCLSVVAGGSGLGIYSEGFILYTCCVFAMQYKVISIFIAPNWIFWLLWMLSFAGYFLFTWMYGLFPSVDWYSAVSAAMNTSIFWLAIVLVPLVLVLSDFVVHQVLAVVDPTSQDVLIKKLAESVTVKGQVEGERESGGSAGFVLRPISQSTAGSGTMAVSPMAPRELQENPV
jgi:hypothetical protein